jgi:transposase
MKIDGRTLDHATLEQIRLMAIRRVRDGEDPGVVIASYGFSRTTIYKWMSKAAGSGNGLRALRSTRGTGRPRSLTAAQERQVFRWVNGRDPRQYGLDFGLWTRAIVALLIKRKFGIALGVSSVGSLLAKLQLTPQKPLQRVFQRDPQAITLWQQKNYPTLARQAKRDGRKIRAGRFFERLAKECPDLFAHWKVGMIGVFS